MGDGGYDVRLEAWLDDFSIGPRDWTPYANPGELKADLRRLLDAHRDAVEAVVAASVLEQAPPPEEAPEEAPGAPDGEAQAAVDTLRAFIVGRSVRRWFFFGGSREGCVRRKAGGRGR